MSSNKETGRYGEDLAEKYLSEHGYRILKRNYVSPAGEIDLIALKDEGLYFIEVKSRQDGSLELATGAIDERKREHIRKTARYFLQETSLSYEFVSFDAIIILWQGRGESVIEYMENIL